MKTIVLVVDDQPDIRKLIRMTLDSSKYELHEVENGQGALHTVEVVRPHVVLLDATIPGSVDGYAVCAQIKKAPELSSTLVVLITARGQPVDMVAGASAGCDGYLTKPFSPLELIDTVERLMESRGRDQD